MTRRIIFHSLKPKNKCWTFKPFSSSFCKAISKQPLLPNLLKLKLIIQATILKVYLSLCPSVYTFVSVCLCLYFCLCMSICLHILGCLSVCLLSHIYACLSFSAHSYVCEWTVCLSIRPFIHVSRCPPAHLYVCPSISPARKQDGEGVGQIPNVFNISKKKFWRILFLRQSGVMIRTRSLIAKLISLRGTCRKPALSVSIS